MSGISKLKPLKGEGPGQPAVIIKEFYAFILSSSYIKDYVMLCKYMLDDNS